MAIKFRPAKLTAYVAGLFFASFFILIWPGSMLTSEVLTATGFGVWTMVSRIWALIAATFIIIVPLVQEVMAIWRQHRRNKRDVGCSFGSDVGESEKMCL